MRQRAAVGIDDVDVVGSAVARGRGERDFAPGSWTTARRRSIDLPSVRRRARRLADALIIKLRVAVARGVGRVEERIAARDPARTRLR